MQRQKRCCKYDAETYSHWHNLIVLARAHVPQWTLPELDIIPGLLRAEIFRKPTVASGVSRKDLQAAESNLLQCAVCSCLPPLNTFDGTWPLH